MMAVVLDAGFRRDQRHADLAHHICAEHLDRQGAGNHVGQFAHGIASAGLGFF